MTRFFDGPQAQGAVSGRLAYGLTAGGRSLNRDAILDHGYSSKHTVYYCGDRVVVEPKHRDEGLTRFRYSFPDGAKDKLTMYPLRKEDLCDLLTEAGLQTIHTYGDFQETYHDEDPDFFIHVAEKTYVHE